VEFRLAAKGVQLMRTVKYIAASFTGLLFVAFMAQAQTFTTLYGFTGKADGGVPEAPVMRGVSGNLYGTTSQGGYRQGTCHPYGCGIVFHVTTRGEFTVLHAFKWSDGSYPDGALISDSHGNLYGTTQAGGAFGVGTVFVVGSNRKQKVLHSFNGSDGEYPLGPLIRDKAGHLYGATSQGGIGSCGPPGKGCGVVFKLDETGKESVLYSFTGGSDGGEPLGGGLVADGEGNLYGTTRFGGLGNCGGQGTGCGVVFKVDKTGNETVLYTFKGDRTVVNR
jgi:uncharacterized repeat protein (TIGR03803 family)